MADQTAACLRGLLAILTVDRVFGAIGDRVHVAGGAADGIAGGGGKGRADQKYGGCFVKHGVFSSYGSMKRN
jgi:hypothetical protein